MRIKLLLGLICLNLSTTARSDMKLQWLLELPVRKPAWERTSRMRRDVAYLLLTQGDLLVSFSSPKRTPLLCGVEVIAR